MNFLDKENSHILLDENIYKLKKEYFILNKENNTFNNLNSNYINNLLSIKKDEITIFYKSYKGILTYNLTNIVIIADNFLKKNKDFDFFININKQGIIRFRARGKIDVSLLAKKIADGGGHPNASGATFNDWIKLTKYTDVKTYFYNKIKLIK